MADQGRRVPLDEVTPGDQVLALAKGLREPFHALERDAPELPNGERKYDLSHRGSRQITPASRRFYFSILGYRQSARNRRAYSNRQTRVWFGYRRLHVLVGRGRNRRKS